MASTNTFTQRGNTAVQAGDSTVTLTWTAQFANVPFQASASLFSYANPTTPYVISVVVNDVTTEGAIASLSAEVPDDGNQYYLAWEASSQQPTPTCEDTTGCSGGCGCGGGSVNVAYSSPPPVLGAYLFPGAQGQPGPLAFFRGEYDSEVVYVQTPNRTDVVTYAGYLWRVNNATKNLTASWGTPTIGAGDWLNIGIGTPGGYNSLSETINITGNSTILPASANHTEKISLGGAAGSRIFAISIVGRQAGDRCYLNFTFPATVGLVIYVRNNVVGGTQLLPSEIYPLNAFTTDGSVLSLSVALVFDGTAWTYDTSKAPA